mgnify:CR=1 FL=1
MKIKLFVYFTLLIFISFSGYSQERSVVPADNKYEQYEYIDAISIYEKVAEKGYKDEQLFQRLGNAYYFNANFEKAAKWYDALFLMNKNQGPEYLYRYSQALKSKGDYNKANKILDQFEKTSENDLRAKLYQKHKNYLEEIKANSGRFNIADAGVNSEYSDYGSSFLDDKLVFASARDTGGVSKNVFKWNNQSFTNFYTSKIGSDDNLETPKRFGNKINSKFHEATPVFTKDGKTMYFTRNNFLDGKRGKDSKNVTLLKIYKSTLEDGQWSNITELPFNSNQYSVAHPALSLDDATLYFASDMPGTLGQSDLFKVTINENGTFSTPENLGPKINTEGRETFPVISGDNELYFASDGRPGLGGLDIYVTRLDQNQNFGEIKNIGEPVNSPKDDFAFLINSETRKGFFTSNRDGGKGFDDIYKFTETKKLICEQSLAGVVKDKESGELLTGVIVSLFDENFKVLKESTTDSLGQYRFEVVCGKTYYVRVEKENYETSEKGIAIADESNASKLDLELEKRIKPIGVGTDLAKTLNIPIIYFDLDKSFIRKDAMFELEKIIVVMNDFPKLKIDIRSHTDSRQTEKYNNALSDRRAKSTRDWLIKAGIDASRLTAKGYGESQLVNHCADGVKCSELEHQANRRSEFVILSIE